MVERPIFLSQLFFANETTLAPGPQMWKQAIDKVLGEPVLSDPTFASLLRYECSAQGTDGFIQVLRAPHGRPEFTIQFLKGTNDDPTPAVPIDGIVRMSVNQQPNKMSVAFYQKEQTDPALVVTTRTPIQ